MSRPVGQADEFRQLRSLLPRGLALVLVDPSAPDTGSLHPVEVALGERAPLARRRELLGGRVAAHACLADLRVASIPILVREDGAPAWPDSVRGSIAHTAGVCLAVAGLATSIAGVGVDVEPSGPTPSVVRSLVLTQREAERSRQGVLDPAASRLAFCLKEAYYKWCRSIGHTGPLDFHDVEIGVDGRQPWFHPGSPVTAGLRTTVPAPKAAVVVGATWVVALVWSGADIEPRSLRRQGPRVSS